MNHSTYYEVQGVGPLLQLFIIVNKSTRRNIQGKNGTYSNNNHQLIGKNKRN